MAYHKVGDRVRGDFLDVNGNVIKKYDYICFGSFFSKFNHVRGETTLIRIYLHYKVAQKYMDYYLEQLKLMGFFKNVKIEAVDGSITLSLNPDLVTAQEMFWVSTCVRVCCFNSSICRNFYEIHRKTRFDAGKLILLNHFFNVGKSKPSTLQGYFDHTLIGGYNPCNIRMGIDEMLKLIRSSKYLKLRNATNYSLNNGYQSTLRIHSHALALRGQQVFSDVSQFKEFLCQG
jgi:hypothetical protein